ncbi:MAG: 3'-5' exonuclease [Sulfurimonas sp.]|uniref:UvrD-helicase domain-containing protein n=1 Tax=Sulfurimonas sp. TaxID=2022749 RepID=UPI00261BF533|nr:UvrD-helicase domain-containing protein [Sulfurimonas sp.]MDD5373347.1 3'-5' exonuclease [Sulfurimonas sp.]
MSLKKISLTKEQSDIVEFFGLMLRSEEFNSLAIKAFAGCGKSFILKYLAFLHSDKKFLGLAFNTGIASENSKEFPKKNCKWFTVHKFARTYLVKAGVSFDFKNQRAAYKSLELIDILGIKDRGDYLLADSISEVFKVFCQSALKEISPESIKKAAKSQKNRAVSEMNDAYLEAGCVYANRLWSKFENNEIAPTFDFYLKYFEVKEFARSINEFDVVELDEAQDSNAVTMSIIHQIKAKYIFVGDEHQSIYAFRGTVNALKFADKSFYISSTFRYIPKIAARASDILSTYKGEKVPITSLAAEKKRVDGVTAYLSRNNSSMISLIKDLVAQGVFFKTVKEPKELFKAALAMLEFRLERSVSDKDFMYLKRFSDFEEVEEYVAETNDNELGTALKMQKQYGKGLYVLLKHAEKNYKSKEAAGVVLSTAHVSKGLEWDNVKLLSDFPDIIKLLKDAKIKNSVELMKRVKEGDFKANEIVQEINLFYVAVTRARFEVEHSVERDVE